jgi:hypothetical protein
MTQIQVPTKTKPIEGRVAQILNERELVINIGSNVGVNPGMKFRVLSGSPLVIRDPQTNEVIDTIDREKVQVEAREVRPRITICRTFRSWTTAGLDLTGVRSALNILAPARVISETLRAEDASLPPPLTPEESYVKINDRVILIQE